MKALKATQRSGVPIAERQSLRSCRNRVRVDGVEIGEFEAGGAAGLDGYGDIPAEAGVSSVGVEIEGADPVIARGQAVEGGVAVDVGVEFGDEIFGLRDVGGEALDD